LELLWGGCVAADGKNYTTTFYNLDATISVGYRVKSAVATCFRIWATQKLREVIVKGFGGWKPPLFPGAFRRSSARLSLPCS
jgi:hypothetical protein